MSCHKNAMTTLYISFMGKSNVMTTSVITMQFFIEIMTTLKELKPYLNGHMINRILHSWSCHIKFIKLVGLYISFV